MKKNNDVINLNQINRQELNKNEKEIERIKAKIGVDFKSITGTIFELIMNKFGFNEIINSLNDITERIIDLSLLIDLLYSKQEGRFNNNCELWDYISIEKLIFFREELTKPKIFGDSIEFQLKLSLVNLKKLGFINYKLKKKKLYYQIDTEEILNGISIYYDKRKNNLRKY